MQDPSQGVHRDLLPHVHLLSTYRFPVLQSVHHNKIAEWLLSAPKIVRDTAPFYWSYLDKPSDGTILLTWQPLDSLGITFATDGYMWPPVETAFQIEVDGGYTLEMYQQKAGYGPGEQFAIHGRRRYRLIPPKFPIPALPTPDPALWITHYYQAEPADRVPSSIIPMGDMRVQQLLQTRMYLQTQGQIVQKEFMLHDRTNWPQIQFPRGQVRQTSSYMGTTRTPQTMAYPPHQAGGSSLAPPAKRPRTQANPAQGPPTSIPAVEAQDDEEDTSRGDFFDHMTPREVSMSRYKQNHEWMEEILSSPYNILNITPVDLGLGLRGELGKITDGIFHAPTAVDYPLEGHTGDLDPDKADEFRKRASERINETNAEMERMRAKHTKRMAKFKRGTIIVEAEKELRTAVDDPTDVGTEYWRLEGRIDENEDGDDDKRVMKIKEKVDDIVSQVEASLGRHVAAVKDLRRIQDGGLEESPVIPSAHVSRQASQSGSQHSGVLIGDGDLDIGGSAAGLLDQFHTGFSSTSTPGNSFPTPQPPLQANSSAGTPRNDPSPPPSTEQGHQGSNDPLQANAPEDVEMSDAAKDAQATGDWVVVPEGGVSPLATSAPDQATTSAGQQSVPLASSSMETPDGPATNNNTDLDLDLSNDGDNAFTTDANDFGSLDGLDTAGEALAGYGNSDLGDHDHDQGGDHGDVLGGDLDLGMDMGLDDSAFGDAFRGVERDGLEDGDDGVPGEGMGDGL